MTRNLDLNMRLAPSFTLREAIASQVAARKGIDNRPSPLLVVNMVRVAERILQPVRDHYGVPITPSSWFRSWELNKAVGGSMTSQHMSGQAVDFEVPGVSNLDLARLVADICDFDELILEFHDPADPHSGWVHVSYVSAVENRRRVLRTSNGIDYLPGLEDDNVAA